jgi:malto-oligosyltrehalose trehalohydrolase
MPFGAEPRDDGSARFRLWAPAAQEVELVLQEKTLRMHAEAEGWHSLTLELPAGALYRFRIDGRVTVPDPASRCNPEDVHGPSQLVDPTAFDWSDGGWRGRPWEEAIVYELHIGTFTPEGTFAAAIARLDHLAQLGVTAVELMPVADFPGRRNWGYDGVLPFAPDASYGTPEDLKAFVAAAHARGLMVLLDVVYNHFGPEGNFLHEYAPQFFDASRQTPWGAAIDFSQRSVRDFFIHNALYWVEEFHMDGLRLDAVHAIQDDGKPQIVSEICAALHSGPGRERHVHVVLENDSNQASLLERDANAQWNDDFHHAAHVLATGERDGYYADYAATPVYLLGRTLAEGFGFQGERSPYRDGRARGERSAQLPPTRFVDFLQSHDQVGNRAFGERITHIGDPIALRAMVICLLLSPGVPMLFMGEEFAASTPFLYFCDFPAELAAAVREGRRAEFGRFARFADEDARAAIPDPGDAASFAKSKLDWREPRLPRHADWHGFYRDLILRRRRNIVPRLAGRQHSGSFRSGAEGRLRADWSLGDGTALHLRANFGAEPWRKPPTCPGYLLYSTPGTLRTLLPPFGVLWTLGAPVA